MKQFIAGYIIDNLFDLFEVDSKAQIAVKKLSGWLSHFQVNSKSKFENNTRVYSAEHVVLLNILQRGIPTRMNMVALHQIVKKSTLLDFDETFDDEINISFTEKTKEIMNLIYRSLHIIDARIDRQFKEKSFEKSWENMEPRYEENFFFKALPEALTEIFDENSNYIYQLLSQNRPFKNIIDTSKNSVKNDLTIDENLMYNITDYSLEFPYYGKSKPQGIVVEVDGIEQTRGQQYSLGKNRDKLLTKSNWAETLRLNIEDFDKPDFQTKIKNSLTDILKTDYAKTCRENFHNPLWLDEKEREILQITLIPFGIARIQRVLLELISQNKLSQHNPCRIAVIERDVPCARLAVDDLIKLVDSYNQILPENKQIFLPEIELKIFSTSEFQSSKFQTNEAQSIEFFDSGTDYDLVMDIAVLERSQKPPVIESRAKEVIALRSVHYLEEERSVLTDTLVKYRNYCKQLDRDNCLIEETARNSLNFLLQSFFRKIEFSEGQLQIINRAFQGKSVIGLLPTCGGKSMTYQMSSLLQPGVCLIVAPSRALLKDQVYGLLEHGIDSCFYLNPTAEEAEKKRELQNIKKGNIQFIFATPEQLQMPRFRDLLQNMYDEHIYFSYGVIDEVHCFSEWGHDFRTSYLRLGENILKYCKTKNLEYIPLFGLTATATFDVLIDIQKEMSGNIEGQKINDDAIIRSEYANRDELYFFVKNCVIEENEMPDLNSLRNKLGAQKQDQLINLLDEIPQDFNAIYKNPEKFLLSNDQHVTPKTTNSDELIKKFKNDNFDPEDFYDTNDNAGLIFCPHKSGYYGVTDRFNKSSLGVLRGCLDNLYILGYVNAGFYIGHEGINYSVSEEVEELSNKNQVDFIKNKTSLMIATKDFGIGINKKNIRYTVHLNYPQSIESFVQEAGRAGRDGRLALSYILFNDQQFHIASKDEIIDHDFEINKFFVMKAFKGIEKEMSSVNELLTEIYFPGKIAEIEDLVKEVLKVELVCDYVSKPLEKAAISKDEEDNEEVLTESHHLYLQKKRTFEKLGFIDLVKLLGFTTESVDIGLSKDIFNFIIDYFKQQEVDEPIYKWFQKPRTSAGIEGLLEDKEVGDSFEVVVGFDNNISGRVKQLYEWLKEHVHPDFDKAFVLDLRKISLNAESFIIEVENNFKKLTRGDELIFEELCKNIDAEKEYEQGTSFNTFQQLYNGFRDKRDTEKIIYRFLTLGIIDDYTVDYAKQQFTLHVTKKDDAEYFQNLKNYLLKYYSHKAVKTKLARLEEIHEPTEIRKYLRFLVEFTHDEIQKKREQAILDMREACRKSLKQESASWWLKEYINLYFNSKYIRKDYTFKNRSGDCITASITDDTDNGRNFDMKWVWKYIQVVDEDPSGSQIDNLKHLQGACRRLLMNQPDSYTILFLDAYTIYMLDSQNPDNLREAENLMIHAFTSLQDNEPELSLEQLDVIYKRFIEVLKNNNDQLEKNMKQLGFSFDSTNVMLTKYIRTLQKANSFLKSINKVLNL